MPQQNTSKPFDASCDSTYHVSVERDFVVALGSDLWISLASKTKTVPLGPVSFLDLSFLRLRSGFVFSIFTFLDSSHNSMAPFSSVTSSMHRKKIH